MSNLNSFLLEDLESSTKNTPDNELPYKEVISRIDFCVDFETNNFEIDKNRIVAHSKAKRNYNESNIEYNGTGKVFDSVRIGKMPNKQLAIYNKIKEIKSRNKSYWWNVWNIDKTNYEKQIWRVEARAGKKELRQWNLKTFNDLEEKAGNVILHIFNSIRYVNENNKDTNQSRWKNAKFWDNLIEITKTNLFDYIANANRELILDGYRNELVNTFKQNINGSIRAYTALTDNEIGQLPEVIELLKAELM